MIENKVEKHVLPSRLTLLDPFCSELRVAQFKENLRYVAHKNNTKLAIETYASSIVGQDFLVSRTPVSTLKQLTYYSVINSSLIPWYNIKWRHISVVHYYFLRSFTTQGMYIIEMKRGMRLSRTQGQARRRFANECAYIRR